MIIAQLLNEYIENGYVVVVGLSELTSAPNLFGSRRKTKEKVRCAVKLNRENNSDWLSLGLYDNQLALAANGEVNVDNGNRAYV